MVKDRLHSQSQEMSKSLSLVCLHHIWFICPPVGAVWVVPSFGYCESCSWEHWCTNICLSSTFSSLGYILPRRGTAGSYDNFMFNFLRNCQTIFHTSWTNKNLTTSSAQGFQFLHTLANVYFCLLFSFYFGRLVGVNVLSFENVIFQRGNR